MAVHPGERFEKKPVVLLTHSELHSTESLEQISAVK